MMRSIVGARMNSPFLVMTVTIALMAFGVTKLRGMPVDVVLEFSPPYEEIQTEALGLPAKEVEAMITVPVEQDLLAGVAWLDGSVLSRCLALPLCSCTLGPERWQGVFRNQWWAREIYNG